MLPSVSIIICAYTEARWDNLLAALLSMQHQTWQPLETIVVIDHNVHLLERLQAQALPISVIENREPQGLSGARNSGIAVAQGEIIAFLDDDAIAAQDWLAVLVSGYTNTRVMGVGGLIEPLWENGAPRWFPEEFHWVVGCTYRGMPETAGPIRNLIGCNMSLRREVFEAIGGFRVGIGRVGTWPVGCEETELCIRAGQYWSQRIMLYQPQAKVAHFVPAQRGTVRYFWSRCFAEGLSKALVAQIVGSQAGLASERTYALHTLPQGITRGALDAITNQNWFGFARAGMIIGGLACTTIGYIIGKMRASSSRQAQPIQYTTHNQ